MALTDDEIGRRIEVLREAKKRAVEAGNPRLADGRALPDDEIDRAIKRAEAGERPMPVTIEAKAAPPKCENCGRPKTPKSRGWWCNPCRAPARSGVEPTPLVNPRPAKPTYDRPTALERQQSPEPAPSAVEPAPPPGPAPILAEVEAMRAVVLALAPLDAAAVARVVRWLSDRFTG